MCVVVGACECVSRCLYVCICVGVFVYICVCQCWCMYVCMYASVCRPMLLFTFSKIFLNLFIFTTTGVCITCREVYLNFTIVYFIFAGTL